MCDQNNALDNPIQTNGHGFHHSLSQTSNLMAQYGLSLCDDNKPMKSRITRTLVAPIKNNGLQALSQSLLSNSNQIVGAQTTAVDYALSTRFSFRRLLKDLLQILHRNNQVISYSLEPADFSMRVYMWKNHLFAACQSIKLGDCNKTFLFCHLVHLGGNQAKLCIDKKCIFRTVMPLSKYCCIKFSSTDLDCVKITHLSHLEQLYH
jgi:hypothetical protein